MSHFPVILIPPSIQQAKSARLPTPIFTESLPQHPGAKPQKINNPFIAVEVALAIIISAAITSSSAGLGFLLFIAAAGAIGFQAWQQIKTYPQRKRDHQREAGAYPKKLEDYNYKKCHYEQENKAAQSPERIIEFQYRLLRDVLSRTSPHDGDHALRSKSVGELTGSNFRGHLSIVFPLKLSLDTLLWRFSLTMLMPLDFLWTLP